MKMQDESRSLALSKQHINSVLFVACFAAVAMAIFASVSLYPGSVKGQELGGTEVGAVQNATNMSSSVSNSSLARLRGIEPIVTSPSSLYGEAT
jgi:hypothetical protein